MILDTNALSAYADNDRKIMPAMRCDRLWFLPVIVLGEYKFGLLGSDLRVEREKWLDSLIAAIEVLVVDEDTTDHYALVRNALAKQNRKIPPNDAWIAALALQHKLPILSQDKHFDHIPDITRITW